MSMARWKVGLIFRLCSFFGGYKNESLFFLPFGLHGFQPTPPVEGTSHRRSSSVPHQTLSKTSWSRTPIVKHGP